MRKHKGIRALVLVSVIFMILGSLCIGVGIAKGGDLRYLHVGKDTVSWWPFRGTFGIQLGDHFGVASWQEDENVTTGNRWEQKLKDIKSLTLEIQLGDVRIERGNENKITFLDIREKDVTIQQEQASVSVKVDNSDVMRGDHDDTVIITLKDTQYERIRIDNKLGDVQVSNLSAKHISVEEKLGDISLENITSSDLSVLQSAGDIDVEGRLLGNSVVKNSLGDIDVTIRGDQKDYRYKVKNSMGDTQIQDREWEVHCDVEEGNQSSGNYLQIHSSMGEIDLYFEK